MTQMEMISVVIPTFNKVGFVLEAIESIKSQTTTMSVEIIVVDDGSKDGTADQVPLQYPDIQFFKQENQGVSAARNHGVSLANGDWILFLDADDLAKPDLIKRYCLELKKHSHWQMVYADAVIMTEKGEVLECTGDHEENDFVERDLVSFLKSPYIPMSGVLMRKKLFTDIKGFDQSLKTAEDTDIILRALKHSLLGHVQQTLVVVRKFENSLSNHMSTYEDERMVFLKFRKENIFFVQKNKRLFNEILSDNYLKHGDELLYMGKNSSARKLIRKSLQIKFQPAALLLFLKSFIPASLRQNLRSHVN